MYFEKKQNLINNSKNKIQIVYLDTLVQEKTSLRTNEFRKMKRVDKYPLDNEDDEKEKNIKEITVDSIDGYMRRNIL